MKLYRKTDDKTYQGAPARDVTEEEFARLRPLARRVILQSGSWEVATVKKAEAPETDAVPTTTELAATTDAEVQAATQTAAKQTGTAGKKG